MNADNQENAILWVQDNDDNDGPLRRPNDTRNVINEMNNLTLNSNTVVNTTRNNEQTSTSTTTTTTAAAAAATSSSSSSYNNVNNSDNVVQSENLQNNLTNIISTSRLSVDAREWYPRNFTQQSHSVQNRLSRIKHETEQQQQQQQAQQNNEIETNYDGAIAITRVKEMINAITYDPGKFEMLLDSILEIVQPYYEDVDTVDSLADTIFEQATLKDNFRYNGARLCNILQDQCALFGTRLYILCEKGVHSNDNIMGVTYFLAELYTQLHVQSMYGRCLLDAMKNLIAKHNPDGFKCVCQSLKLSGYYLDIDHKSSVDEIFNLLETESINVAGNLKNIYKSVGELRTNNWGHNQSNSTNGYQEQNGYLTNNQENDFFLDGPEMSAEEHEFLANCEEYSEYINGDFDPDDLYNPEPEMDEEIRTAFRAFVQLSKQ